MMELSAIETEWTQHIAKSYDSIDNENNCAAICKFGSCDYAAYNDEHDHCHLGNFVTGSLITAPGLDNLTILVNVEDLSYESIERDFTSLRSNKSHPYIYKNWPASDLSPELFCSVVCRFDLDDNCEFFFYDNVSTCFLGNFRTETPVSSTFCNCTVHVRQGMQTVTFS